MIWPSFTFGGTTRTRVTGTLPHPRCSKRRVDASRILTSIRILKVFTFLENSIVQWCFNKAKERTIGSMIQQQHQQQQTTTALDPTDIDLPSLEALTGFLPFWDAGVGPFDLQPLPTEEQLVLDETRKLQTSLRQLTTTTASSSKDDDDDDDENQTSFWQDKAHELQVTSQQVRWEGYREFIYFVLNTVAFYSYMFCILVWYFDDDANKPTHVQYIMFGLDNAAADWHGNFWGDLMWTIEPIVILGTPYLFARLKQNQRAKLQQRAMAATGKTKTE
mmetsp:Transcript_8813/g.24394  ORF Transcript_8813/g.24394 Transcript_8813/m.24394 type:complete len:276 (-) Transcript_8813:38-865(-)